MKTLFVRDKSFYIRLISVALPVAVQNLVNFGVSMADTVMLGMMGDIQLSASSIGNQLGFIYMLLCFGIGSGSSVMISQYWGSGEKASIHRVMSMMYRFLLVAALVFSAVAIFLPYQVVSIFTVDPEVIEEGTKYLRIIGISYLFAGCASSSVAVLRSVGAVRIPMVIYLSSLATNITLNYILIFGHLGFPAMGVQGAAIATCIARVVEVIILIIYLVFFEKRIRFGLSHLFSRKLKILDKFTGTAVPVVFNELLWGSGVAIVAVIIGRMGTEFVAANSICSVLSQFVTIAVYGVGNAAGVIIGNTVGEGDYERVRAYARTFVILSVLFGLFSSGVVLLVKGPLLMFYNISDLARMYASQIMSIYAVVVIFQSMAMVSLMGVLRGAGDTRFVLICDVVFMWVISIPLGFLTGLYFDWPVAAVYCVIKCDELFKTIMAMIRFRRGNWINDLTANE